MESTWASGAIELLRHADLHINLNTAFDKRIAFISIDNSVETLIRSFLSLPSSKSGIKVDKKDIEEAGNIFPKLLSLLYRHASSKLVGIDDADIEHYHRIRNKIYHEGTGLSVDDQYLRAYRSIAALLLQNLFNVSVKQTSSDRYTLEKLILNWNEIEHIIKKNSGGIGITANNYNFKKVFTAIIKDNKDLINVVHLKEARNRIVHSNRIDQKDLEYWVDFSEDILKQLKKYYGV